MKTVKTKRDALGAHSFECAKCQKEGFLGFWQDLTKYPSPMNWTCSFCGEKISVERTPFEKE